MPKLYTVEELAEILRLSKSSIAHSIHKRPQSLPPIVRIPGTRRVLFRDVENWLDSLTQSTINPSPTPKAHTRKAKSRIKRGQGRRATPAIPGGQL